MKEKTAKAIRVLALPPIILFVTLLLLRGQYPKGHLITAMLLLCVLPLLSYPVWRIIPPLYRAGRAAQRKLAVIFSVTGYLLGLFYCLISKGTGTELFVYLCYLITGALIAISSYGFNVKSSGHAAGVAGPVMILALRLSPCYLFGALLLIPVWFSSVSLGRHTKRELLIGASFSIITALILAVLIK